MTDERFFELCKYERQLAAEGYSLIAGIDEAGRGPLAGPVAAACVIFKSEGPFVKGADDSKKLSEKRRESLFEEIKEKSFAYGISLVDNHRIDEINILQATYEAMRNALEEAIKMADDKMPGMLLVDHVHIPQVEIPQISITHGDAQSVSIASASILAKVSRDRLMKQFDEEFPQYGFAKHKGYGTKAHYEAIAQYGPSEIHRMTFLKKLYS
jgi:ribonuclease HII